MEISFSKNEFKIKGKKSSVTLSLDKILTGDFIIDSPGEYEVGGVDVIGLRDHVYRIHLDDVSICVLNRKLEDDEKTRIGTVNIVIIPATNSLDTDLEPAYVIPFGSKEETEKFAKSLGAENIVPQPKLVTSLDKLPETTTVIILE